MPRSHRLRSRAGAAAALVAAMVLAPTAALAAQAPATPAAPAAQAPFDVVEVAPTDTSTIAPTPVETAETAEPAETGTGTGTSVVVGDRPASTPAPAATPAPSATPAPAPSAPAPSSVVVVPGEPSEPDLYTLSSITSPGENVMFFADYFTPGDAVKVDVDGPVVTDSTEFFVHPGDGDFVFDTEGSTYFDMDIPATLALGTFVLTVSDQSGLSRSIDMTVREPIAAPTITAPTDATAGVVSLTGSDAVPGSIASVVLADGGVVDEFDDGAVAVGGAVVEPLMAENESSITRSAAADSDDWSEFPYDTEPVTYDPDTMFVVATVPVAADGTFTAEFVVPAGEYVTFAQLLVVVNDEDFVFSPESDLIRFAVAEAVATPTPGATTPPVVVPAGNTTVVAGGADERRVRGALAYTGADQGVWIAGAAALLALGTALVAAPRLRRRFGR